jgi:membrane fusion protein (multidrug efflux system)
MELRNLFLLGTSAFLLSLLLISCGGSGQQGRGGPGGGPQQAQPYPVLNLQPRSIVLTNSYPATLEGAQTVEIRPRVQGYITAMRVDEGDLVNQGEVLFELNSEQYEQEVRSAEADVEAAKASISTAEDEVKRFQSLVEKEIISNYRLQSAKNALESQKAARAQAEARLENAQVNLGYTNVKSPATGIIGTIPYRIGSLVSSNITEPLTIVSDVSNIYAYFSMGERELLSMTQSAAQQGGNKTLQQQVAEMPEANLMLADGTAYGRQGTIKLASGLINSQTGSASFRAVFPNPDQILRSGSTGNIQIPLALDSVFVIPKKSTFEIQDKKFVYTVADSNIVISTAVQTRTLSTQKLYVVEEGLSTGDRIVTAGMTNLQDSTSIKPQPISADSLYEALTVEDQQNNGSQYQ